MSEPLDRDLVMDQLRDAQDPPTTQHALETIEQALHERAQKLVATADLLINVEIIGTPSEVEADLATARAAEAYRAHKLLLETIHAALEGTLQEMQYTIS